MLTKPELEAIRERVEKATPGDWHTGGYFLNRETNRLDLTSVWGPIDHQQITKGGAVTREDGEFISKAKTDIPALLQHISELETQLAEAQAQVEGLVGAIQRLKDRMTTGYIDCEGPYEDICATRNPLPDDACWVCITSLWLRDICAIFPTEYLPQPPHITEDK